MARDHGGASSGGRRGRRATARRLPFVTRMGLLRLSLLFAVLAASYVTCCMLMTRGPGESYDGPLPDVGDLERDFEGRLREHVHVLAGRIGERNLIRYGALQESADYVEKSLTRAGLAVDRQAFEVEGRICYNLEAVVSGSDLSDEIVIVGGHYDSVQGCPGANDNATGVAATLELARTFAARKPRRSIRFLAFVNEEPPYFQTDSMGSRVYSRRCRERGDKVVAMLSLETMGYYSDEKGSQRYPVPFGLMYPSTGNFIAFVGNFSSRELVRQVVASFREHTQFPSEMGALPGGIPGVGWSDHWSFWQEGYPGLMVTDTAPYRYDHYHEASDTPDKVDYDRLARVVAGLAKVLEDLANPAESK